MRRLLILFCVVAFLVALPMSHLAFAAKADKVEICHITPNYAPSEPFILGDNPPRIALYGHVVSISENAIQAHLDHGDYYPGLIFPTEVWGPDKDNGSECVVWIWAD